MTARKRQLGIKIDDDIITQGKIKALQLGITLSQLTEAAIKEFCKLSDEQAKDILRKYFLLIGEPEPKSLLN